jgi:small nuclear ribonucleoprotein (snRNP)-like protein
MEKVDYYNNKGRVFKDYAKDSSKSQGTKNFETQEKKPLRYGQDSFTKELIGKIVNIELINGKMLQGKLLELGMYDVQIEIKSSENFIVSGKPITKDVLKTLIVLKSAIISVEVLTK